MKSTEQQSKKNWFTPKLTTHGDIDKITQSGPKNIGGRDAIVLGGQQVPVPGSAVIR